MVMVVFDVTNKQSFSSCSKWLERVKAKKVAPESPLPGKTTYGRPSQRVLHTVSNGYISYLSGVLVANKVDLKERRLVGEEEGRKFASTKDLQYYECSAVSIV